MRIAHKFRHEIKLAILVYAAFITSIVLLLIYRDGADRVEPEEEMRTAATELSAVTKQSEKKIEKLEEAVKKDVGPALAKLESRLHHEVPSPTEPKPSITVPPPVALITPPPEPKPIINSPPVAVEMAPLPEPKPMVTPPPVVVFTPPPEPKPMVTPPPPPVVVFTPPPEPKPIGSNPTPLPEIIPTPPKPILTPPPVAEIPPLPPPRPIVDEPAPTVIAAPPPDFPPIPDRKTIATDRVADVPDKRPSEPSKLLLSPAPAPEPGDVKPLPLLRPWENPAQRKPLLPLTSTYAGILDEQRVIVLPRAMLDQVGEGQTLLVSPGPDRCLWVSTPGHLERLAKRLEASAARENDLRGFRRLYFAQMEKLTISPEGRIQIPERLAQFADLHQEVVLVGIDDHFELWDTARWRKYTQAKSAAARAAMSEK